MDAWEQLISGSTIETGDAWDHLLAQGGGSATMIVHADGLEVEMATTEVLVEIDSDDIAAEITPAELEILIDQSPLEAEV